jgi:hypothetical protein
MLNNKRADAPAAMWSLASRALAWTTFSARPRLPVQRCPTDGTERASALLLPYPTCLPRSSSHFRTGRSPAASRIRLRLVNFHRGSAH